MCCWKCLSISFFPLVQWLTIRIFIFPFLVFWIMAFIIAIFKRNILMLVKVKVKSLSHIRLCDSMDCSPPGFSIHGVFQARVLEWVAISFSRESAPPRDQIQVSCIAGRCFTLWATREAANTRARWMQIGIWKVLKRILISKIGETGVCVCVVVVGGDIYDEEGWQPRQDETRASSKFQISSLLWKMHNYWMSNWISRKLLKCCSHCYKKLLNVRCLFTGFSKCYFKVNTPLKYCLFFF